MPGGEGGPACLWQQQQHLRRVLQRLQDGRWGQHGFGKAETETQKHLEGGSRGRRRDSRGEALSVSRSVSSSAAWVYHHQVNLRLMGLQ